MLVHSIEEINDRYWKTHQIGLPSRVYPPKDVPSSRRMSRSDTDGSHDDITVVIAESELSYLCRSFHNSVIGFVTAASSFSQLTRSCHNSVTFAIIAS